MKSTPVIFPNPAGIQLSAVLDEPIGKAPIAFVIFAHCFTCGKNISTATRISAQLVHEGFGVLRFDFTGLGQSDGAFAETSFLTNLSDLYAAADYLKANYRGPQLLIGHSLGGTAVIHAADKIEGIKAICTIGSPFEASHVAHLLEDGLEEIERNGKAMIKIGGRPFPIGKKFIDDLQVVSSHDVLHKMRKALLILHSPQDEIVEISNAAEIYKSAFHPKSFVSLDGGDHLLSNKADAHYAATVIAAWAARYLSREVDEPSIETEHQVAVQIEQKAFTTEVQAGRHFSIADEPIELGGKDEGPSPYQLLCAALGTCTAMTLKLYADRKKWTFKKITVHLSHSKSHKADAEKAPEGNVKMEFIQRLIKIEGDLTAEQRAKMLEIANKCPVHRTLTEAEVVVETKEMVAE